MRRAHVGIVGLDSGKYAISIQRLAARLIEESNFLQAPVHRHGPGRIASSVERRGLCKVGEAAPKMEACPATPKPKTQIAHNNASTMFIVVHCYSPSAAHLHRLGERDQLSWRSLRRNEPRLCATRPLPAGETRWRCLPDGIPTHHRQCSQYQTRSTTRWVGLPQCAEAEARKPARISTQWCARAPV